VLRRAHQFYRKTPASGGLDCSSEQYLLVARIRSSRRINDKGASEPFTQSSRLMDRHDWATMEQVMNGIESAKGDMRGPATIMRTRSDFANYAVRSHACVVSLDGCAGFVLVFYRCLLMSNAIFLCEMYLEG
jgi:hypothetical protein